MMLNKCFSPEDDAYSHFWTDGFYYGHPTYDEKFIAQMFRKALADFAADPRNTTFLFVVPNFKNAGWYKNINYFE